eukprot:446683_1
MDLEMGVVDDDLEGVQAKVQEDERNLRNSLSHVSLDLYYREKTAREQLRKDSIGLMGDARETSVLLDQASSNGKTGSTTEKIISVNIPEYVTENFKRVIITGGDCDMVNPETAKACKYLQTASELRERYLNCGPKRPQEGPKATTIPQTHDKVEKPQLQQQQLHHQYNHIEPLYDPFCSDEAEDCNWEVRSVDGIYSAIDPSNCNNHKNGMLTEGCDDPNSIPTLEQFYSDMDEVMTTVYLGPVKTLAFHRLCLLEAKFQLHTMLNSHAELTCQKKVPHRDFYNIRKVDTHIHHSAAMNLKQLLRFIKDKLKSCPNEIVSFRDGDFMTLKEVFESLHLTAYDLSIDTLDMHADPTTFHRFDRFNLKYSPAGESRLREIFLKTDNVLNGRFLAELTKKMMSDLGELKYQHAQWRLSIYGRRLCEWDKLSRWFFANKLSHTNIRWMIQIPRLYDVCKKLGEVACFQDFLDRIFAPLFEASVRPSSNITLHVFLKAIIGFDSVDDESRIDHITAHNGTPTPSKWQYKHNPPYSYFNYYLWANIMSLNILRASRGLNTFSFNPHCGEAGDIDHLCTSFLIADSINHGITLRKSPGLQYLYYIKQIGLAMSPLSNNKLFLDIKKNPFPRYFAIGMNVSLSSDDPLQFHFTKDALAEEFSVAQQLWKLSSTDVAEISRNSVLQSGYEDRFKKHYIGENYESPGAEGNDIRQTNVPDIRIQYRHETLVSERRFLESGGIESAVVSSNI